MNRIAGLLLASLLLAGCSGDGTNPFDGDPVEETEDDNENTIPETLSKNMHAAIYDPENETLQLHLTALDETPRIASYTRTPSLDVGPYQAYTAQDDPLDRHFTALFGQSQDPQQSVRAGVAGDGGQFNRYWAGGHYERDGDFLPPESTPTSGLVSYAGQYTGVTNLRNLGGNLLPIPADVDPALHPRQTARTQGQIFINADFADNAVNGSVYNREFVDFGTALPDIVLVEGVIDENGEFFGQVEYDGQVGTPDIGDFGGIFGGEDAGAIGGIIALTEFDDDIYDLENENEIGVFVLTRCGLPNDDPICDNVN